MFVKIMSLACLYKVHIQLYLTAVIEVYTGVNNNNLSFIYIWKMCTLSPSIAAAFTKTVKAGIFLLVDLLTLLL